MKAGITDSHQKRIDNAMQEILAETEATPISEVNVDQLQPYPQHPFRMYEGERLHDMVESVKQDGIIQPIVVRRIDNGTLQILAGHNRVAAAKAAGMTTVPARVLDDVDDVTAERVVYTTNFLQRSISDMAPSEAAALVSRAKDSLTFLGWRGNSKNSYRSREIVADRYGLSQYQLDMYLRIDKLLEDLKPYVDEERIRCTAAVDISHISYPHQLVIAELLRENPALKISGINAEYFKTMDKKGLLTPEIISETLIGFADENVAEEEHEVVTKKRRTVPHGLIIRLSVQEAEIYFPGLSSMQAKEKILDAMRLYHAQGGHNADL